MKFTTTRFLIMGVLVTASFAQLNFEVAPLVQLPGYNAHFRISNSQPWGEQPLYVVWESTLDSSSFSIYRLVIDPTLGAPQIIATSTNLLSNPDVNGAGDVVWEEWAEGSSSIKYYSNADDSISTLTDEALGSTQPNISGSAVVYIQNDTLKYLNVENQLAHNIDFGGVSNPDLAPDMYTSSLAVAYEKSLGDQPFIRTATRFIDASEYYIYDYGTDYPCANPRYGSIDWLSYQQLVDGSWSIVSPWDALIRPYDTSNPFVLATGIVTLRIVNDDLVLFESDSLPDNREIFCSQLVFDPYSTLINVSNMPGNDYNPQAFYTSGWDSVAVVWEHEVENGRELWWAKDTLHIPVDIDPGVAQEPESFLVGEAYPNPFNGGTRINYTLPSPAVVQISVFDLNGRLLATAQETRPAGTYTFAWDGLNSRGEACGTGVYLLSLSDGRATVSRKIVLLK